MYDRIRAQHMSHHATPQWLDAFATESGAWWESEEQIRLALADGKVRAALLRWVRRQMASRLTARERYCVECHYFLGLTYEAIGYATNTHRSTVCRALQRSLRKLRQARDEDPSWRQVARRRFPSQGPTLRAPLNPGRKGGRRPA